MLRGFLNSVQNHPQHTALIIDDTSYSYMDLMQMASAICNAIQEQKIQNSLIGIYTDNNVHTYSSILAILLSGNGFVPLNSKFPDERLKNIIEQSEIKLIVACQNSHDRVSKISSLKIIAPDAHNKASGEIAGVEESPERIVYLLFTSGSTGIPKGIPIAQKNFNSLLNGLSERYNLGITDKVLQTFELSFDVSIGCMFLAWKKGASLVVVPLKGIVAVNAFKTILDHRVNFVVMAPSAVNYMKKYKLIPHIKLPFVTTTLFTGEALFYETAVAWKEAAENTRIENAYGPTEVTVWCFFYEIDFSTSPEELVSGLCPIGKPLKEVEYKVTDEKINTLSAGQKGELLVAGNQVFSHYWKNNAKTNEVLLQGESGNHWYKTGDIVLENSKGNIVYINRKDNQVKINGFRIEIGEVEFAIRNIVKGAAAAVVAVSSSAGETELVAFAEKGNIHESDVMKGLKAALPFYMIPRNIIFVDVMPLNSNGKIDRNQLKQMIDGKH